MKNREAERIKALKESNIIDVDVDFSYILESIATICKVPYCSISAVAENELYVIASYGKKSKKIQKREGSCTNYTILKGAYCEIEDVRKIDEISDGSLLFDDFKILSYAGYPLGDTKKNLLGSLNLFDDKPRIFTEHERYFIEKAASRIERMVVQTRGIERYRYFLNMFNKSKDILGIARYNGEIVYINPAFYELLGYDGSIVAEHDNIINYIPDEYKAQAHETQSKMSAEGYIMNNNLPLKTKSGENLLIEWTSTDEPKAELVYFVGRNITEVEEQSIMLKNSESRFRAFFENSQTLMCMHTLDGKILSVNKNAAQNVGLPIHSFEGRHLADFMPPERLEQLNDYLNRLKEEGEAVGTTYIYNKQKDKTRWLYTSIVERDDKGEAIVLANGVDITDRYQIEKEMKAAKKEAEEANRAKSEFIANMSHEIRTPLNGIIGFTDLMMNTSLSETQKEYIKIINQSGNTLLGIIDEILDFSRIESKRIIFCEDKIDLQNLASDACSMVLFGVEKKGLELLLDLKENLPRYIWTDEVRLKQVLVNLLSNAVKFTEEGEVKLTVELMEELPSNEMILRFKVCDTGIGIQPQNVKQIFKAFTQEDGSITKKYGGTGLGLTISNNLLELMNSELDLISEVGKGSCFFFDLKLKAERDTFDDEQLEGINKILVVDDNDSNRQILRRMLELKNIEVDEAESGLKALLMLQTHSDYDVIIMDYHMPLMDGIETIRKSKEITKGNLNQPIIMLYSSSDDLSLQNACEELQIESRLVKPIKMQEMYKVLARLKNDSLKKQEEDKNKELEAEGGETCNEALTVLIAEDNEVNLYLAKIIVEQIAPSAQIVEARDGVEAVDFYKIYLPDIVLMDIQMPNKNGHEATKEIRALAVEKQAPIIALTAGNMVGEREKCLESGMDDFISKPVVKQTVRDVFCKWLKPKKEDGPIEYQSYHEESAVNEDIPHFNKSWIDQYDTGDNEFKNQIIELTLTNLSEIWQALLKAVKKGDLKQINALGHKLKGTSATVGLTRLNKLAINIENIAFFESELINSLLDAVNREIDIVKNILEDEKG